MRNHGLRPKTIKIVAEVFTLRNQSLEKLYIRKYNIGYPHERILLNAKKYCDRKKVKYDDILVNYKFF